MVKQQEQEILLKRHRLSTYQIKFGQIKKEFLTLKWTIETNTIGSGSKEVIKKMDKVAKNLFEIEKIFEENMTKVE